MPLHAYIHSHSYLSDSVPILLFPVRIPPFTHQDYRFSTILANGSQIRYYRLMSAPTLPILSPAELCAALAESYAEYERTVYGVSEVSAHPRAYWPSGKIPSFLERRRTATETRFVVRPNPAS